MRINALVASIDDKKGVKNGKPWRIVSLMLIEKAKARPKCKTPLILQLADDDLDILDHCEDEVLAFDITEIKAGFRDGEIECRGSVVRADAPPVVPAASGAVEVSAD